MEAIWAHSELPIGSAVCLFISDIIMSTMASQVTSASIVCLVVGLGRVQRKHQISALLAFVRGIHRWPDDSPHKGPVTPTNFPFDNAIMLKGMIELRVKLPWPAWPIDNMSNLTFKCFWKWIYAKYDVEVQGRMVSFSNTWSLAELGTSWAIKVALQ